LGVGEETGLGGTLPSASAPLQVLVQRWVDAHKDDLAACVQLLKLGLYIIVAEENGVCTRAFLETCTKVGLAVEKACGEGSASEIDACVVQTIILVIGAGCNACVQWENVDAMSITQDFIPCLQLCCRLRNHVASVGSESESRVETVDCVLDVVTATFLKTCSSREGFKWTLFPFHAPSRAPVWETWKALATWFVARVKETPAVSVKSRTSAWSVLERMIPLVGVVLPSSFLEELMTEFGVSCPGEGGVGEEGEGGGGAGGLIDPGKRQFALTLMRSRLGEDGWIWGSANLAQGQQVMKWLMGVYGDPLDVLDVLVVYGERMFPTTCILKNYYVRELFRPDFRVRFKREPAAESSTEAYIALSPKKKFIVNTVMSVDHDDERFVRGITRTYPLSF
jgi:hypothetical protein